MISAALLLTQAATSTAVQSCYVEEQHNGVTVMRHVGARLCVDLMAPREMSGVWIDNFEGSSFHEGITDVSELRNRKHQTWLSFDDQSILPPDLKPNHQGTIYRITFIGRRTREVRSKPFEGYGHFGMSPSMVLVDHVLHWEKIGSSTVP